MVRQEVLHALQGIIYEGRKERKGTLSPQKASFARSANDAALAQQAQTDLSKAVELVGPDALIGAAAQGGAFSEGVVRTLTEVRHDGPSSLCISLHAMRKCVRAIAAARPASRCQFADAEGAYSVGQACG